jgi:hypothetical protein
MRNVIIPKTFKEYIDINVQLDDHLERQFLFYLVYIQYFLSILIIK